MPPSASEALTAAAARFRGDLHAALAGEPAAPVLLAVSGGGDSMAMLLLASAAGVPIASATVDHRLRPASAAEATLVADACATLGVDHAVLVPAAAIRGSSLQARARGVRYDLLARHAAAIGAGCIVTAHHADDAAETLLMRAARGAGLAGMAGIRPRTTIFGATVVRPLLAWRRAELRALALEVGQAFVDDPANDDPRHDRTRFRRLLAANRWLDPPRLARAAAMLAEADADFAATADLLWTERAMVTGSTVRLAVTGLPREIRRRLLRRAITTVRAAAAIVRPEWDDGGNIEPLLDLLHDGHRATRAGVVVAPAAGEWIFVPAPARREHR